MRWSLGLFIAIGACGPFEDGSSEITSELTRAPQTFYVDAVVGNDSLAGTAASPTAGNAPWKSVTRVNLSSFVPGDRILFRCGQTWSGTTLKLNQGGAAGAPIVIGSYPESPCVSATRPRLDPTVPLTGWVAVAGQAGLYSTTFTGGVLSQVILNSARFEPARFPVRSGEPAFATALGTVHTADGKQTVSIDVGPVPAGIAAADFVGATVELRDSHFTVHALPVGSAALSGTTARLTLTRPGGYAAPMNAGYYLIGKGWMARLGPGWAQEGSTLYVRLPGNLHPASVVLRGAIAQLAGIDAQVSYITIQNLLVQNADEGVRVNRSTAVRLEGVEVTRSGTYGIVASNTLNGLLQRIQVTDTLGSGVQAANSTGFVMEGSVIQDSGTIGSPRGSAANFNGFNCGPCKGVTLRDNRIVRSGYAGISLVPPSPAAGGLQPLPPSLVERNLIEDSCAVLDDCGALYTSSRYGNGVDPGTAGYVNPLTVRYNLFIRSKGNADGRLGGSSAQGIYFDDYANGLEASNNVVYDADSAIQHHLGWNTLFRGNILVAPRKMGLWLQENALPSPQAHVSCADPNNCMHGDRIEQNWFIPASRNAVAVHFDSSFASTEDFATMSTNHYFTWQNTLFGRASQVTNGVRAGAAFAGTSWGSSAPWPEGRGAARESNSSEHALPRLSAVPSATDVFPAKTFEASTDLAGSRLWPAATASVTWSATQGNGSGGIRVVAPPAAAGANSALLSFGQFPVAPEDRYLVSLDVRAEANCSGCAPNAVIIRNNDSGWEVLATSKSFMPTTQWQTLRFMLPAYATSRPGGARLDLQVAPGTVLFIDNLRLQRVTGTNLAVNGDFADGLMGWRGYPTAQVFSQGADGNRAPYLRVDTRSGTITTIVSSRRMSLTAGRRYLLRYEARGVVPTSLDVLLRRDAPSYNAFSTINRAALNTSWQVYSSVIDATQTTAEARLDFHVGVGGVVDFDNIVLTEIPASVDVPTSAQDVSLRPAAPARGLVVYYNGGTAPVSVHCPAQTDCAAYQALYVAGVSGRRVSWPIALPPKQAAVLFAADQTESGLADQDEDGVLNQDDWCANTPAGSSTDEAGCSFAQTR